MSTIDASKPKTIELKRGQKAELRQELGIEVKLENVVHEQIEPDPTGAYPAGSGTCIHLQLVDEHGHSAPLELCRLSAEYDSRVVGYFQGCRIRWAHIKSSANDDPTVVLEIEKLATSDYKELGTFELKRDKSVAVDGEMTVTFVGHSHKQPRPGQRSPLILFLDYQQTGHETARKVREQILPDDPARAFWHRNKYRFERVAHAYDRSMKVKVFKVR